jgi:hypothetical protein
MLSASRSAIFERLKHSIQLLACPAEIQLKLLPDFVCKADEFALDFDHWKEVVLRNFSTDLSTDQKSSIERVDNSLLDLTGMGPEHWTEEAVLKLEEWKHLRTLAVDALDSFGWLRQIPPSHADEYIGGTH